MKVLITGASGQLGRELQHTAPLQADVLALDHAQLDITQCEAVEEALHAAGSEVVINAAAYNAVDRAEEERDQALAVNAVGVRNLARAATAASARLIHLSTDFVFDGTSHRPYPCDATPNPLSAYGDTKWRGERHVLEICGDRGLIIRTAWVYSRFGQNFVKTMLRLMAEREEIGVVADQVGTPTWARGLSEAIWAATDLPGLNGVHHWTDAGVASWFDFAVAIHEEAEALQLLESTCRIRPLSTDDYPTSAKRPAFSVLDKHTTWRALDLTPPHWRVQLRGMLHDLKEHRHA